MAWDTTKLTGDTLTATEWDDHVTDQKGHKTRHQLAGVDEISIAGLGGEPSTLTTHKGLTTGTHGVTGTIVGTSDSQALTNKSVNGATIALTTPVIDQVLKYNGIDWVNGNVATVGASTGISFYNDDTTIIATGTNNVNQVNTLTKTPMTTTEVVDAISVTTNTILGEAYLYNTALGRATIDAGTWQFDTYCSVNTVAGGRISTITRNVFRVIIGTGTLATTGTGTSRTATITTDTPFLLADANANLILSGYLQTPQGLYQITAFTSNSIVTIETPSTYVNETGVSYNTWRKLFNITTDPITFIGTSYGLMVTLSTQSSFSINTTDKLASIFFATSNNTTIVNFVHNGNTHNSHFDSPLIALHNDLAGLQGGSANQFYHLTANEYTGTGTDEFVRKTSPTIVTPTITTSIKVPIIKPPSDSTTSVQITKADGSTGVVIVDTTNSRMGVIITPRASLDVGTGYLVGTGLQLPHIINKVASANIRNSHDAEATSTSATYVKLKTITLTNGLVGQQRFLFDLKSGDGKATVYGQIYRNGIALGTEQTDVTGGYVTKSEDLTQTWNPGDTAELWAHSDGAVTVFVQNFRIAYDDLPTVTVGSVNT